MDQVEVDGSYILINDFEDRKSEGEIFIYPIDISVDDGEAVMIMDREYFEAEDPDFEIISFEVLPTDEPLLDKLLVSSNAPPPRPCTHALSLASPHKPAQTPAHTQFVI